eukprot:TRINITY_DN2449_c2_g1_i2.p1 TRINITY_DN2449_c2_g1~~TRINITY_DN2449_c2_g1_i2.p1  ORF type:complete len:1766 (+),score=567.58 TRINITY_DN2449_c2_g1_i2:109-5406(+)
MTERQQVPVFVRVRPLNQREINSGQQSVWSRTEQSLYSEIQGKEKNNFHVNQVFGETCETEEVFNKSTKDIIAHAIQGWSGTVFAYGQTSSGKTHTMMGSNEHSGIVQLALHYMWQEIERDTDADFIVRCTCMEVYNERLTDLHTGIELDILESKNSDPVLKGETPTLVSSADHAIERISQALEKRHVAKTNMNDQSSRSHTIFRIQIDRMPKNGKSSTRSLLHLVDLAGSESIKKTGTQGSTAREGGNINQSLSALVRVIKCLTEKGKTYVPFRDSKLTRLLKTSLGGNTKTAIICCITSAEDQYDQTVSTLRFAQEASKVKNDPKRCLLSSGEIPPALRATVQAMASAQSDEIREQYRGQLQALVMEMEHLKSEQEKKQTDYEKMLHDEREKRRAAESALFQQNKGAGNKVINRRQTMVMGGGSLPGWSPQRQGRGSFAAPLPKRVSTGGLDTLEPHSPTPTTPRLSRPRMSTELRRDLEAIREELAAKSACLLERESEILSTKDLLKQKEEQLKEHIANKELLEDKLVKACEMGQLLVEQKDKETSEVMNELSKTKEEMYDSEMARHRMLQEMSELQAELRKVKTQNRLLDNAEKEKMRLQQQATQLASENCDLEMASNILETNNAAGWQSKWNNKKHVEELNDLRQGLEKEMNQRSEALKSEIAQMKQSHTEQIESLTEEQARRDIDFASKLESLKENHAEELSTLTNSSEIAALQFAKDKEVMQREFEAQILEQKAVLKTTEESLSKKIEELKEEAAVESGLRQRKYEEDTSELRAKLEVEMKAHEGKMRAMQHNYDIATEQANRDLELAREEHRKLLEEANKEASQRTQQLEAELRSVQDRAQQEVNRVKRDFVAETENLKNNQNNIVKDLERKLQESSENHEAELARVEQQAEQATSQLKSEAQEKLKKLEATFNDQLLEKSEAFNAHKEQYEERLQTLQNNQKRQEEQAAEERRIMETRFERKEKQLQDSLFEEKSGFERKWKDIQLEMEANVQKIKMSAEGEKDALRQKTEALKQQQEELIAREESTKNALNDQLAQLKNDRDKSMAEVENRYSSELHKINDERRSLDSQLQSEKAAHQNALDQLEIQKEAELSQERMINQQQLREVADAAAMERSQLQQQFSAMKEDHKAEVNKLSQEHLNEKQRLQELSRQEVARLNEAHARTVREMEQHREQQQQEYLAKVQHLEQARISEVGLAKQEIEEEKMRHNQIVNQLSTTIEAAHREKEVEVASIKQKCEKSQQEAEAAFKQEIEEREKELSKLEEEKEAELIRIKEEMESQKEEAASMQTQLEEQLQHDLQQAAAAHSAKKAELEAEIGTLQGDAHRHQEAHMELNKQHDTQIQNLEQQHREAVQKEKADAEERQRDLLERKMALEEEAHRLGELTKQQKEELDCSMMAPLREARNILEKKLSQKRSELSDAKQEIQSLRKKVGMLEADKEQLRDKLKTAGGGRGVIKSFSKPPPKTVKSRRTETGSKSNNASNSEQISEEVSKREAAIRKEFEKKYSNYVPSNQQQKSSSAGYTEEQMRQAVKTKETELKAAAEQQQAQLEAKIRSEFEKKFENELHMRIQTSQAEWEARAFEHANAMKKQNDMTRETELQAAKASSQLEIAKLENELQTARNARDLQAAAASDAAAEREKQLLAKMKSMESEYEAKIATLLSSSSSGGSRSEKELIKQLQQDKEDTEERIIHLQTRLQKITMEKCKAVEDCANMQDKFEETIQNEKRKLRKQFQQATRKAEKDKAERSVEVQLP